MDSYQGNCMLMSSRTHTNRQKSSVSLESASHVRGPLQESCSTHSHLCCLILWLCSEQRQSVLERVSASHSVSQPRPTHTHTTAVLCGVSHANGVLWEAGQAHTCKQAGAVGVDGYIQVRHADLTSQLLLLGPAKHIGHGLQSLCYNDENWHTHNMLTTLLTMCLIVSLECTCSNMPTYHPVPYTV